MHASPIFRLIFLTTTQVSSASCLATLDSILKEARHELMAGGGVCCRANPNIRLCDGGLPFVKVNRAYPVIDNIYLLAAVAPRLVWFVYDDTVNKLVDLSRGVLMK